MIEHHLPSSLWTYSVCFEGGVTFLTNKSYYFLNTFVLIFQIELKPLEAKKFIFALTYTVGCNKMYK